MDVGQSDTTVLRRLLDDLWPFTGGLDRLDDVFYRACHEANYWPERCLATVGDDDDE